MARRLPYALQSVCGEEPEVSVSSGLPVRVRRSGFLTRRPLPLGSSASWSEDTAPIT